MKKKKTMRIDFRVTAEQKAMIEKVAVYNGLSLSSFILTTVLERTYKDLPNVQEIVLSKKDSEIVLGLLDGNEESAKGIRKMIEDGNTVLE